MGMKVVFVGPPGAGKGTQAENIVKKYGLLHLSTGDMLRAARDAKTPVGLEAEKYMSAGQLVPDEVIIKVIVERLAQPDAERGYLLDGFPRTVVQAEELDKSLAAKGEKLDVILHLAVFDTEEEETKELVRRLVERGRTSGRSDDTEEVIRQRLDVYHKQTAPLIDYYKKSGNLVKIQGEKSIPEVAAQVESILDNIQV